MKSVILGARGVIGNALFKTFSSRFSGTIGLTSQNFSGLTAVKYELSYLRDFVTDADLIIYCVGVSKFSECDNYPEKSLFLNVQLPTAILKLLSPHQTFIYFSSPIVLNDFGAQPVYNYARHKHMAEEALQTSSHGRTLVIRPSKIIESASIVSEWKTLMSAGKKITAFFDQFISPINTTLLSDQLIRLIETNARGTYNFSARDRISYADLSKALADQFKLDSGLIEEKSARSDNPFFFEQDILDCSQAEKAINYEPPFSRTIVDTYLQALV